MSLAADAAHRLMQYWRPFVLVLCAGSCAALTYAFLVSPRYFGTVGLSGEPTDAAFVERVTFVAPGSPAQRAGLRPGDLIDARSLPPGERYRWAFSSYSGVSSMIAYGAAVGDPFRGLRVERAGNVSSVTLAPQRVVEQTRGGLPANDVITLIGELGDYWAVAICALIAWRGRRAFDAQVLTLAVIAMVFTSAFRLAQWLTPVAGIDCVASALYNVATLASHAFPLLYVMHYAGRSKAVRACVLVAWTVLLVRFVSYGADMVGTWSGWFDLSWLNHMPLYWNIVSLRSPGDFMTAVCLLAMLPAVPSAQRTQVAFVNLALTPTNIFLGTFWFWDPTPFVYVTYFTMPLILSYALISRRLLDVQFVLNRAAVFAGVSFVLVGIFVLAEWLMSDWLQRASHSTNLAVTGLLALVLGLSIRFVHARVEHVVDNVFFRKRRQDEEAIRTLAREAPYITQRKPLLARTEDVLSRHAGATSVEILLDSGNGTYGNVDENDAALVALRARHATLDLHGVETAIRGEVAYPMVARGRLVGALVLGPKRSGESYAPDESQAIEQLAHSVAAALDVMILKQEQFAGDVRGEVRAVHAAIQALPEAMRGIVEDAIAAASRKGMHAG